MERTPTGFRQLRNLRQRTAADIFENSPNDPGPFRGIIPAYDDIDLLDSGRGRRRHRPPIGLLYHPEGDLGGFSRARIESLDREGRGLLHRWDDDLAARPRRRTGFWPPRDESADDLALYETRYEIAPPERSYYQQPPRSDGRQQNRRRR